jgi:hypothetical protein
VGYGRRPELAFIWSAAFILVGSFVFLKEKNMIQVEKSGEQSLEYRKPLVRSRLTARRIIKKDYYNPFWYSLDLFLPFVDLKMADKWTPKPERRFARHYMRFQTIAGWILIPIAILSITGIIK